MEAFILSAAYMIPLDTLQTVLHDHALVCIHGEICAILPREQACTRWPELPHEHYPQHVLLPGLINAHTHSPMSVLRGVADDFSLSNWLETRIWPLEKALMAHQPDEMVFAGSLLAAAEMLTGGITTFNDMYFYPEASARAAAQLGIRAHLGLVSIDFPSHYATNAADYLARGQQVTQQLRTWPTAGLFSTSLAPHAPYTVGDAHLAQLAQHTQQYDTRLQIHLHETDEEIITSQRQYGCRPLQRLHQHGLVNHKFTAIHGVALDETDIALLAAQGASVVHCPVSNLKLGSGIAPIAACHAAGIPVGLGTDGCASNNRLDLWQEMRLAALLAKGKNQDARVINAWQALWMATQGGARALGLQNQIGSLQVGKAADVIAVSLEDWRSLPRYDLASHLVYVLGREHVVATWVNGCCVARAGECCAYPSAALTQLALHWQTVVQALLLTPLQE